MDRHSPIPLSAGIEITNRLRLASQCVPGDAYDQAAFDNLLAENPQLECCKRRGETLLHCFPELLSDVFRLLFKLRPVLADRTQVRPAFQINRYLLAGLSGTAHLRGLRTKTVLDEETAGAGTVAIGLHLLGKLATSTISDENLLFELEESAGKSKVSKIGRARARPTSTEQARAQGTGEGGGREGKPLSYDLQQRLDMAEALKGYRSFERLLALIDKLLGHLVISDLTEWRSPEVYEIGLGQELSRLLPSELLGLRVLPLKKDFLRRLIGGQLLNYEIRDQQLRGHLVILVDASHSMAGNKELASKALAIALWQVAASQGQPVSVILFGPRTVPLWHMDSQYQCPRRQQIAKLAEMFFGGGTDFERPISTAIDLISQGTEARGQVVLVSDGLCPVSADWLVTALRQKARRQIPILTVLMDMDECSDQPAASFSDRIIHWSQLTGNGSAFV